MKRSASRFLCATDYPPSIRKQNGFMSRAVIPIAARVLNEAELEAFLKPYGFRTVELSQISFREQVELFHRAEIVLGPHGAGLNVLFHCGKIPVVVLHPNQKPQNHYHTLARGLGQDYHFVLHHGDIDSDFEVDLPALKRVLEGELGLRAN